MKIIRRAAFTPVPWRNGGGVTHEALRVPAAAPAAAGTPGPADPFRWRVSVADIGSSGPFSDFSGYHRTLVLLRGNGVRLSVEGSGERVLRQAGDLAEFDGGTPTAGMLLDGPCSDLNLMVSHALPRPQARVEPLTATREWSRPAGVTLVFPITGALTLAQDAAPPGVLDAWDLAVLHGAGRCSLRPRAGAGCLVFFATLEDNFG